MKLAATILLLVLVVGILSFVFATAPPHGYGVAEVPTLQAASMATATDDVRPASVGPSKQPGAPGQVGDTATPVAPSALPRLEAGRITHPAVERPSATPTTTPALLSGGVGVVRGVLAWMPWAATAVPWACTVSVSIPARPRSWVR